MKLFILLTFCLSNIIGTWPITRLEGTSVSIASPAPFKQWGGLNGDETDNQVSKVEKYIMSYSEIYTSNIYVTTFYPDVKFNLAKSVEGNIRGMIGNKYWHGASVTERKNIIVCGVSGIRFTIRGKLGEYDAQATSVSFRKGSKWYIFTNTFGTSDSENLITSDRMLISIK